jgi:glutamate--cysteine ligase
LYLNNEFIFDGNYGLERETMRVTTDGALSQSLHPFPDNKNLERDFCENQLELITPVCQSIDELMTSLNALDKQIKSTIAKNNEYLWINSNPPHIKTEADIPIAQFVGANSFKSDYRINLEHRYGKRLMLYSGIHFNFSFSDKFIKSIYDKKTDFMEFTNALYLRLAKQTSRYSWLLVLLTAASPVYDLSLDSNYLNGDGFDGYSSRRNSDKGYWNQFIPTLDYTDLKSYIESIENYVQKGALFSAGELYIPIRLKPAGENKLGLLAKNGINHIELRMFDLNPLSPVGVLREDLEFAHYFLIYLLSLPDFEFTENMQKAAIKNHKSAARYNIDEIKIDNLSAFDAATDFLDNMSKYFQNIPSIQENIAYQKRKLTDNKRYCVEVYNRFYKDFHKSMLEHSKNL